MSLNNQTPKPPDFGGAGQESVPPLGQFLPSPDVCPKSVAQEVGEDKTQTTECPGAIPKRYQPGFLKVMEGKGSPRQAIKAKCLECMGYEQGPVRIKDCQCTTCPLWMYRPYQKR